MLFLNFDFAHFQQFHQSISKYFKVYRHIHFQKVLPNIISLLFTKLITQYNYWKCFEKLSCYLSIKLNQYWSISGWINILLNRCNIQQKRGVEASNLSHNLFILYSRCKGVLLPFLSWQEFHFLAPRERWWMWRNTTRWNDENRKNVVIQDVYLLK